MIQDSPIGPIVNLITSFPSPEEVLAFKLTPESQERLTELLYENSAREMKAEEQRELDQYMMAEHIMRLARINAKVRLRE